jgi:hypothetical protein
MERRTFCKGRKPLGVKEWSLSWMWQWYWCTSIKTIQLYTVYCRLFVVDFIEHNLYLNNINTNNTWLRTTQRTSCALMWNYIFIAYVINQAPYISWHISLDKQY